MLGVSLAESSKRALPPALKCVVPINSTNWWQRQVAVADEWMLLIKTASDHLDALVEHIKKNHSYDTPEIVATPITGGNPDYLNWVREETRGR